MYTLLNIRKIKMEGGWEGHRIWTDTTEEEFQMANEHMERC